MCSDGACCRIQVKISMGKCLGDFVCVRAIKNTYVSPLWSMWNSYSGTYFFFSCLLRHLQLHGKNDKPLNVASMSLKRVLKFCIFSEEGKQLISSFLYVLNAIIPLKFTHFSCFDAQVVILKSFPPDDAVHTLFPLYSTTKNTVMGNIIVPLISLHFLSFHFDIILK